MCNILKMVILLIKHFILWSWTGSFCFSKINCLQAEIAQGSVQAEAGNFHQRSVTDIIVDLNIQHQKNKNEHPKFIIELILEI